MFTKTSVLLAFVASGLWGCADSSSDADETEQGSQDLTAAEKKVSTFECSVGPGLQDHDDVAKFTFKVKGFKTASTKFVESGWKVLDKNGHALESDGEKMSVVAEGFGNGSDIRQCRKDPRKGLVCGQFVMSLDNTGSGMPVSLSLTKKSEYREGTLTIDNTINTGDNSGWLHAHVTCTIGP